jgi:membrane associated rhomboid family serine protease
MIDKIEDNVITWGLYNWYRKSRDPSNWWYTFLAVGIILGIIMAFAFFVSYLTGGSGIEGAFVGLIIGVLVVGWISYKLLMKGYL